MSGYRRFIAYVYEYPQGKKGMGKGFIRVEARSGVCRMRYKLSGSCGAESGKTVIYGYVRTGDACLGIRLGTCDLTGESAEFEQEFQEENLNGSGYSLADLCGVVLFTENGGRYGSGWDDIPLDMGEIRLPESEKMSEGTRADTEPADVSEEAGTDGGEAYVTEQETPADSKDLSAVKKEEDYRQGEKKTGITEEKMKNGFWRSEYEEEAQEGNEGNDRHEKEEEEYEPESFPGTGKGAEPIEPFQMGNGQNKALGEREKTAESRSGNQGALIKKEEKKEPEGEEREEIRKEAQGFTEPDGWKEEWSRPVRKEEDRTSAGMKAASVKKNVGAGLKEAQEGMKSQSAAPKRQDFTPFADCEVEDCRRILPSDLKALACRDQGLAHNNFLRRGVCRYGHLLLGRRKEDNQYILGVPGIYERQECLMANMCGFPYFKETCGKSRHSGRFGYWYRLIDTPDMDGFHSF